MDEISRDTYPNPFDDNADDIRVYTKTRADGTTIHMPSVTTIIDTRNDDKSNLYAWQKRNNGEGDNAFHEHLFWYSRQIGTLGHWHALSTLDGIEWTEDEAESAWVLHNVDEITDDSEYTAYSERLGRTFTVDGNDHEEIWDASPRDVLYSVLKNQHAVESWGEFFDRHSPYESHDYYNDELLTQADRDTSFFVQAQCGLWDTLGVNDDSVIAVEEFLFTEEYEYAGQVDLVYQDGDDVVVADLKSSSGCYEKHQLQGAAYGKAIELSDAVAVDSVDRLEVHRTHPRTGQMVVHTHDGAATQPIHTTKYWNEDFDECWRKFEELIQNFDDVNFDGVTDES